MRGLADGTTWHNRGQSHAGCNTHWLSEHRRIIEPKLRRAGADLRCAPHLMRKSKRCQSDRGVPRPLSNGLLKGSNLFGYSRALLGYFLALPSVGPRACRCRAR